MFGSDLKQRDKYFVKPYKQTTTTTTPTLIIIKIKKVDFGIIYKKKIKIKKSLGRGHFTQRLRDGIVDFCSDRDELKEKF